MTAPFAPPAPQQGPPTGPQGPYRGPQAQQAPLLGLQRVLGFGSDETAWAWLQKLGRVLTILNGGTG